MTNFLISSLKSITNPTEAKIRGATNSEPLGPYNHELIELSLLTYHPKNLHTIVGVLSKRLEASVPSGTDVSQALKRTQSMPGNSSSGSASLRRARTMVTPSGASSVDDKACLVLLKTVTVILYLMQNGSEEYIQWMRNHYQIHIYPVMGVSLPRKFRDTIRFKVQRILDLCANPEELKQARVNIHKLRNDIGGSPGVKRHSSEVYVGHDVETSVLPVSQPTSPSGNNYHFTNAEHLGTVTEEGSAEGFSHTPKAAYSQYSQRHNSAPTNSAYSLDRNNPFYNEIHQH